MTWNEIRCAFLDQWLLIEALDAHSENGFRLMDDIAVVGTFENSADAMREYRKLHKTDRSCEYYVVHTSRENLVVKERIIPMSRWYKFRRHRQEK